MVIREVYRQGPYRVTREYDSEDGEFLRIRKLARTELVLPEYPSAVRHAVMLVRWLVRKDAWKVGSVSRVQRLLAR
jgi:hypothetical protein